MERVSILIDGSNFYYLALKKLGIDELRFDFDKFSSFLANGRSIVDAGKRFYVGTVREKEGDARSKEAMSRQTSLFTVLKNARWEIKTSKLIDWVRHRAGKKVEYIGFSLLDEKNPRNSTNPLFSLMKKTDIQRVLVKSDLQPFVRS